MAKTQTVNENGGTQGDFLTPTEQRAEKEQLAERRGVNLGLVILVVAVVAALAAGIGLVAVNLLEKERIKAEIEDTTSDVAAETERTPEEMEQLAKAKIQSVITGVRARMEEALGPVLTETEQGFIAYRPEGMLTAVPLEVTYGVGLSDDYLYGEQELDYTAMYAEEVFAGVERYLREAGFEATGERYGTWSGGVWPETYLDEQTGVLCVIDAMFVGIHCGYKEWYNRENAELSNNLAKAEMKVTGEDPWLTVANVEAIIDSEVSPYQRISAAKPGYGAMFYRVSPEAEWVYFTSGQAGPACSEFNTDDLRKAFAGLGCYSIEEQREAIVTP